MNINVEDLKLSMQNYIGQLNQLNQRVNEVVGSIKALQQLIFSIEQSGSNPEPTPEEPVANELDQEQDVMQ